MFLSNNWHLAIKLTFKFPISTNQIDRLSAQWLGLWEKTGSTCSQAIRNETGLPKLRTDSSFSWTVSYRVDINRMVYSRFSSPANCTVHLLHAWCWQGGKLKLINESIPYLKCVHCRPYKPNFKDLAETFTGAEGASPLHFFFPSVKSIVHYCIVHTVLKLTFELLHGSSLSLQ